MTQPFKDPPSPHPQERELAPSKAAPLVGAVIIAWTEVERDMARSIRSERQRLATDAAGERKLSHKFAKNLNEWLRLFLPEKERETIRSEALRLQQIRNDVAHNIWTLRLDTKVGVVINVVRENDRFAEEHAEWMAEQRTKGKRSQKQLPETFYTNTYFESELRKAVGDIGNLWSAIVRAERDHYGRLYPQPQRGR